MTSTCNEPQKTDFPYGHIFRWVSWSWSWELKYLTTEKICFSQLITCAVPYLMRLYKTMAQRNVESCPASVHCMDGLRHWHLVGYLASTPLLVFPTHSPSSLQCPQGAKNKSKSMIINFLIRSWHRGSDSRHAHVHCKTLSTVGIAVGYSHTGP